MGHMTIRVQPWQHVSAPNALTFCTGCCWTIKSLQDEHVSEYWNVTWELSEVVLREKGHFWESTTEQHMPFVSSQILQSICYGLFRTQWPSSLLRKEKESHKETRLISPSSVLILGKCTKWDFFPLPFPWEDESPLPSYTNQLEHY